jgi:hypothetical protein
MNTKTDLLCSIEEDALVEVAGGQSGLLSLNLGLGSLLSANVSAGVDGGVRANADVSVLGIPLSLGLGLG